jgi:hypothetical protein
MKKLILTFAALYMGAVVAFGQSYGPKVDETQNTLLAPLADFVEVYLNNTSSAVSTADHVQYNTIVRSIGTNIAADTSTTYTTTVNVNSLGRFTLQPNIVYQLEGDLGDIIGGAASQYINYSWWNADTNTEILTGSGGGSILGASLSNSNATRSVAKVTFAPIVQTRVELRIRQISGITGYGGQFSANRATARITSISSVLPVTTNGATLGDAKSGFQTTDHNGWVILDGRLKTTLTASQQITATNLGFGTNLPNAANRAFVQGTLGTPFGSSLITQANLPNVTLGGATDSQGSHSHGLTGRNYNSTGSPASPFNARGLDGTAVFNSSTTVSTDAAGSHSHNVTTASINGGVAQQAYTPPAIGVNQFVYLGL